MQKGLSVRQQLEPLVSLTGDSGPESADEMNTPRRLTRRSKLNRKHQIRAGENDLKLRRSKSEPPEMDETSTSESKTAGTRSYERKVSDERHENAKDNSRSTPLASSNSRDGDNVKTSETNSSTKNEKLEITNQSNITTENESQNVKSSNGWEDEGTDNNQTEGNSPNTNSATENDANETFESPAETSGSNKATYASTDHTAGTSDEI